jgi:hypothetical protein
MAGGHDDHRDNEDHDEQQSPTAQPVDGPRERSDRVQQWAPVHRREPSDRLAAAVRYKPRVPTAPGSGP